MVSKSPSKSQGTKVVHLPRYQPASTSSTMPPPSEVQGPPSPAPCSSQPPTPTTGEKMKVMGPVSMEHQHKKEKQEMKEEVTEMCEDELAANVKVHTKSLEIIGNAFSTKVASLKEELSRSTKAEGELRAANKALNAKMKEVQEENKLVKAKNEEGMREAQKEIQQAKSEELTWKNNYEKLNEELKAAKTELHGKDEAIGYLKEKTTEEINKLEKKVLDWEVTEKNLKEELETKNKLVGSLEREVSDRGGKLKELEEKVLELETSGKKLSERLEDKEKELNEKLEDKEKELNEKLDDKEKKIQDVEGKYKATCTRFLKLHEHLKERDTTSATLKSKIDDLVEKDKAIRTELDDLKTERSNWESAFRELQTELEKEKNENQAKGVELKKKTKRIEDLKKKVKNLRKEKGEVLETVGATLDMFREPFKRKRSLSVSSSSSVDEADEPSLVAGSEGNGKGNKDTGRLGTPAVTPSPTATTSAGIRTDAGRKSRREKKQKQGGEAKCPANIDDEPQQQNSPLNEIFHTRGENAVSEVSDSSMASDTRSSSGRKQRKTSDGKK